MAAVKPFIGFNLSNEAWRKAIQTVDESLETLVQSSVNRALNDKPRRVVLSKEACALADRSIHRNPAVSKHRTLMDWELEVESLFACDKQKEIALLWSARAIIVRKIWDCRHNAVKSAWDQQGSLVNRILRSDRLKFAWEEKSKLAIDALENDRYQAVAALYKLFDEASPHLKASYDAIEALESKFETTLAFKKAKDRILDDVQKARDLVFRVVRLAKNDTIYSAAAMKVGDEAIAVFENLHGKTAFILQKTHDKASATFEKFHYEARSAFQKTYDETTATLQRAHNKVVPGNKIGEFIIACNKSCSKTIAAQKAHCSALDAFKKSQDETGAAFKKSQDETSAAFKKIRDLSTLIHQDTNETRAAALIANEATIARQVQDELVAALEKDDKALALLLKVQDEFIAATQSLKDQVKALASFLEVKNQTIVTTQSLKVQAEARALLLKIKDEITTEELQDEAEALAYCLELEDEELPDFQERAALTFQKLCMNQV